MDGGLILLLNFIALIALFRLVLWRPKWPKFTPMDADDPTTETAAPSRADDPPTEPKRPRRATYGAARYRTKRN